MLFFRPNFKNSNLYLLIFFINIQHLFTNDSTEYLCSSFNDFILNNILVIINRCFSRVLYKLNLDEIESKVSVYVHRLHLLFVYKFY